MRTGKSNFRQVELRAVSIFPYRRAFCVFRRLKATAAPTTRILQLDPSHGLLKKMMSQDPVIVNKVDLPINEAR